MNIHYNETEKTIEIDDDRKKQLMIVNFFSIINIFNAIVWIVKSKDGFGTMEFILLAVGCISIVALCYSVFTQTNAKIIPISQIKRLTTKTVFGKKHFALQLNNGRSRSLSAFKAANDQAILQQLFQELGFSDD